MPEPNYMSQITLPVESNGAITNVTFEIKDAVARQLLSNLGDAVHWKGVTTSAITDGGTTSPVVINSENFTPSAGDMVQYSGEEFIWNGTAWQSVGKNNFKALAFKDSASASYTPAGTVSAPTISVTGGSTGTVNSITSVGTQPKFTVSGETVVYTPGTLPTKGADTTVVTATGTISASAPTFSGTAATITVS